MPATARVTEASPSGGSYECCEAAAEETAEGTGEGEGGVMCGGSTGEDGRLRGGTQNSPSPDWNTSFYSSHEAAANRIGLNGKDKEK